MIGKLKGKLSEIHGDEALIETLGGVFYRVYITPKLAQKKPSKSPIEVYTYLNVKEDSLSLFAFETQESYRLFIMLVSVDGVGPKTAYTIIGSSSSTDIRKAAISADVSFFQRIKGIGKKTAQRILIDLSGKFGEDFDLAAIQETPEDIDTIDALCALGFKKGDVRQVLSKIGRHLEVEDKIKIALQALTKKR